MYLQDAQATENLGGEFAQALLTRQGSKGAVVYLLGPLGAGKSTFARGLLRGLGHKGSVPSPTYSLVEPYSVSGLRLFHLDLYRVTDASELEVLGMGDWDTRQDVLLIEWPQQLSDQLLPADITIELQYDSAGRGASITGLTQRGTEWLADVHALFNQTITE